jgi:Anthrone oxygenase
VLLELLATLCAGLFAGAAVYVTLVEHPARVECGPTLALREFRPSYRRAAVMQAALAAVGCLAAVGAWGQGRGPAMLVAGLVLGAVIPFTVLAILPTNTRLLDPTLAPDSPEADRLLARWGRLHAVRSVASVVAFVLLGLHLVRAL